MSCAAGNLVCAHVTDKGTCTVNCVTNRKERVGRKKDCCVTSKKQTKNFDCKFLSCCRSCSFCKRVSAKEKCKSQLSVPRGTLVCIWEEFSRKGPPYPLAPQVCLPTASLLVDGISSNLAHFSKKFFLFHFEFSNF